MVLLAALPAIAAAPAAPRGVAMTANEPESVTLSWYKPVNDDATSYNVYAATAKEGPFAKVATVTERTAKVAGLKPDAQGFYKVAAVNAEGEGPQSAVAEGFTFEPIKGAPFPVKIASNMCVSLGGKVVSDTPPIASKLEALVDGSDATTCRLRKNCEVKIQLQKPALAGADYLLLHFRTHGTSAEMSNDPNARTLRKYVVVESKDSTDGKDGIWTEIATGTNTYLDGVILLPNHQPAWIGVRSTGTTVIPATDRRPMPDDLMLARLDVFRAAPAGFRNDYWIFTGDSLVVQDMPAGSVEGRTAWFSDLVRKQHPDRYPIVVHAGRGGEVMANTIGRMKEFLPAFSPPNGTKTPTATLLCFEPGFNDVGIGGGLWMGAKFQKALTEAQDLCTAQGLFMVPVRVEFSHFYLDKTTLEPTKDKVFYNTLAVNLAGVDPFARTRAPYACDPATQLPFADYWTYTRLNHATALVEKDGVHHTKAGSDGINTLWAQVADKMIYSRQKP